MHQHTISTQAQELRYSTHAIELDSTTKRLSAFNVRLRAIVYSAHGVTEIRISREVCVSCKTSRRIIALDTHAAKHYAGARSETAVAAL